ncbi:MAG: hypothetical protein LBG84_05495, partial [Treponema sp.]|nr:hypothetical protein [Treponema sp.]
MPKGSGVIEAALSVGGDFDVGVAAGNPLKLNGTPWLASVGYATEGNSPARIDPRNGIPAGSGVELLGDGGTSLDTPEAPDPDAGKTFNSALAWLAAPGNAENSVDYYLTLHASVSSGPRTLSFGSAVDCSLTLESGGGAPRTIQLNANGSLFTVNAGCTLTLGN